MPCVIMKTPEERHGYIQESGLVYLERLRLLHTGVLNEPTYYAAAAGEIVDALKELAEIVIWGEANNYDAIFDYFCEENLMGFLTYVLPKSPFRVVRIQLLQTISMMLHNLQNERTLYFILSNNHINTLICTPSMYSGGDVSSWTAALLKTVSGLLNSVTIKFFYNEGNDTFPLLEEALRFLSCSDSMKCAHVMTIILNIVRVNDAAVTHYMINNSYMISKLALHLRTSWRRLNNQIKRSNMDTVGQTEKILLTSCDDVFQFLQDVMDVANAEIKEALLQRIFMTCFFPLVGAVVRRMGNDVSLLERLDMPKELTCGFYRETYQNIIMANGLVGKYADNKTDIFAGNYTESNMSSCKTEEAEVTSPREKEALETPASSPRYLSKYLDVNVSDTLLKNELLPNVSYYLLVTHMEASRRDEIRHYLLLLMQCPFAPRYVVEYLSQAKNTVEYDSETQGGNNDPVSGVTQKDEKIFFYMKRWEKIVFGEKSFQKSGNGNHSPEEEKVDYVPNILMGEFIRIAIADVPRHDNRLAMLMTLVYRMQKSFIKRARTMEGVSHCPFEKYIVVPSNTSGLPIVLQIFNCVARYVSCPTLRVQTFNLALSLVRNSTDIVEKYSPEELPQFIEEVRFHLCYGFNALKLLIVAELEMCTAQHVSAFYDEWLMFDNGPSRYTDILDYPQVLLDPCEADNCTIEREAISKRFSDSAATSMDNSENKGSVEHANITNPREALNSKRTYSIESVNKSPNKTDEGVRTRLSSWFFGNIFRSREASIDKHGRKKHPGTTSRHPNQHWRVLLNNMDTFRHHVQVSFLLHEINKDIESGALTKPREASSPSSSRQSIYERCPLYAEQCVSVNDTIVSLGALLSLKGVTKYACTMSIEPGIKRRHAVPNDIFFLLVRQKSLSDLFEATCIHPLWNVRIKNVDSNNRSCTMAITWYPDSKISNGSEVSYCKPRKETSVHDIDLIFETSDDLSNYVKEFKDSSMKRIKICSDILRSYFLDINI